MTRAAGLALGTAQWGLVYGIANRNGRPAAGAVREMLATARGAGVRHLDTARAYGESERVIGDATAGEDPWSVVTKLAPDADSPAAAAASMAASRRALRRDRLDGILLHRWAARPACWDELRRERDAGRVGWIGASALDPDEAWQFLADPEVELIQVPASIFDQRLSRAGFFRQATETGKSVFVRSVFLQGAAFLSPDRLPKHLSPLAGPTHSARQWAADHGVSAAVPFLAYAASLPGVWVLVGCESPDQLRGNLGDWDRALAMAGEVGSLAASIPDLSADTLNPAQWPKS